MFSQLVVTEAGRNDHGREVWKLVEPLTFALELNGCGGLRVNVPSGFETDFASIPRPFWRLFPPTGEYTRACVVHDHLCEHPAVPRFVADAILRAAMQELGVATWKRVMIYYAVRLYAVLWRLK